MPLEKLGTPLFCAAVPSLRVTRKRIETMRPETRTSYQHNSIIVHLQHVFWSLGLPPTRDQIRGTASLHSNKMCIQLASSPCVRKTRRPVVECFIDCVATAWQWSMGLATLARFGVATRPFQTVPLTLVHYRLLAHELQTYAMLNPQISRCKPKRRQPQ